MRDQDAVVVVDGWGPLAEHCVAQLRRLRVRVEAGAYAADAAELGLAAGGTPPRLLVLVAQDVTPVWVEAPSMAAPWHARDVPLLPVVSTGGHVVVGPLVVPGRTACLRCVRRVPLTTAEAPSPASMVLAAALVAVTTLGVLREDLRLAGVSTDVEDDATSMVHRVWTSRPGCRCASVTMAG